MKMILKFAGIFVVCSVGLYLLLAVAGVHQFRGHIAITVVAGAILAGLITAILTLSHRVGELEEQVKNLTCRLNEPEK